jgi:hypothetical protein
MYFSLCELESHETTNTRSASGHQYNLGLQNKFYVTASFAHCQKSSRYSKT